MNGCLDRLVYLEGPKQFCFQPHSDWASSTLHQAQVVKADFDGANVPSTAVQTQSLVREDQRRSQWLSASPGHYKINFDVATKKRTTKATVAAILRDSGGQILDSLVKQWSISSSFQGEALACRCACQLAQAYNLSEVDIEGDNKKVIHLCVSEKVPPWEYGAVFDDIKRLANQGNLFFN